ncbi:phosphoribosyltransferase [Streptomyces sp. NPDC088194]|uniref:phosphoribosyltransferase n=1 Tax=Streptomyces sp. NPDC088194 TaxID=3154931 RepID=UPI00344B153F
MPTNAPWTGQWVADRLGVTLHGDGLADLVGLALRRNPKRAHLLVSQVLGKHVPQDPGTVYGCAFALGLRVRDLLGAADARNAVVLGYAETATGLGHAVADGIGFAPYLHSTRRAVPGVTPHGGFEEEHSHATSHLLLPEEPGLLTRPGPLVLVDDEFSTGRTIRNTIAALHALHPREHYVVVALTDMRAPADRDALDAFAAELPARIDVIALATGTVGLPDGVLGRGQALVAAHHAADEASVAVPPAAGGPASAGRVRRVELEWPEEVPDGGRHGFLPGHAMRLAEALPAMGGRLADALPPSAGRVLVLGNEELMYAPLRLAKALQGALEARARASAPGSAPAAVRYSTTTRSPVLAVDDPGYAIRHRIAFPAHDDPTDEGSTDRFAYNVRGFDAVVCVVDSTGDTAALHAPGGLLDRLAAATDSVLLAVVPSYRPNGSTHAMSPTNSPSGATARAPQTPEAPAGSYGPAGSSGLAEPLRGPEFSSYAPDEVGWLLKDLSDVELEAPTEEREEAIQSGGAHYAESLPVEYQPTPEYQELFRSALDGSARRIARAVGTVTELVLAERGPDAVLVSLARAGTPVGVLMRRWAEHAHGLRLPHYAVSIVRGRGIDANALRWLAAHHDPADVVFVDGWTGKGAITRELAAAVAEFAEAQASEQGSGGASGSGAASGSGSASGSGKPGFDPEIAVLADPGGCVRTYGTRDDFLIPSACLNSTVSGLISRTVLREGLIGPHDFHGAKFYRDLLGADVSGYFLDTVAAAFDSVADPVAADVKALRGQDRSPTWAGWAAVERISEEYGIGDVNLVKPGVGETTRVLLRRVPWKILAKRGVGADLDHVRLLAAQRGVPVEEVDDLPYSCVGLIHPRFTRGATGVDGKAVAAK